MFAKFMLLFDPFNNTIFYFYLLPSLEFLDNDFLCGVKLELCVWEDPLWAT